MSQDAAQPADLTPPNAGQQAAPEANQTKDDADAALERDAHAALPMEASASQPAIAARGIEVQVRTPVQQISQARLSSCAIICAVTRKRQSPVMRPAQRHGCGQQGSRPHQGEHKTTFPRKMDAAQGLEMREALTVLIRTGATEKAVAAGGDSWGECLESETVISVARLQQPPPRPSSGDDRRRDRFDCAPPAHRFFVQTTSSSMRLATVIVSED